MSWSRLPALRVVLRSPRPSPRRALMTVAMFRSDRFRRIAAVSQLDRFYSQ
jgi:hypothetical protein